MHILRNPPSSFQKLQKALVSLMRSDDLVIEIREIPVRNRSNALANDGDSHHASYYGHFLSIRRPQDKESTWKAAKA